MVDSVGFMIEYVDIAIFSVLGIMSFIVVGLSIERMIFFIRFKEDNYKDLNELQIDVSNNLTCIGVIGQNAPYIGLLGTVVGIIVTFYNMSQSGDFQITTIMLGLSLALKATALGILVAIPSLVIHDFAIRAANKRISAFKSKHKE